MPALLYDSTQHQCLSFVNIKCWLDWGSTIFLQVLKLLLKCEKIHSYTSYFIVNDEKRSKTLLFSLLVLYRTTWMWIYCIQKSSEQIKENDLVKHLLNIGLFFYCKQSAVFESLASIYFLPTDVFICDLNAITTWWRCRCESCRLHGATLSFCDTCFVPAWLVWPSSFKKHRSVNRCFSRGTKGTNNQCDVAVVTLSVCLLKCEMLVSVC